MNLRRKLEVTPLEDRTVPTTVTIESLGDATEGGSNGGFRLTRSDTSGALFVSVSLSGTATHGSDYGDGEPFQIVFLNGHSTADWTLIATNDSTSEPTETVIMTITSGSYTIGSPSSATAHIFDNDAQYVSVEKLNDAVEGGTYGVFRFSRIGDLSGALTANVTIGGTATFDTDYTGPATTVAFAVGSASADVNVAAVHDTVYDPGETVTLTVASGTGYSIGAEDEAELTIYDDAAHTFEVASEDGTVWYDIDWSAWDCEDEDPQELALTNFTLNFAGQVFTEANATITGAVAVVEYNETDEIHEVTDIRFTVVFASPVAGVKTLEAAEGSVTGFDNASQQIGDPVALDDERTQVLLIDFSTAGWAAPDAEVTWTIRAKIDGVWKSTDVAFAWNASWVEVTEGVWFAYQGLGLTPLETNSETRIGVTAPGDKQLQELEILWHLPGTWDVPTKPKAQRVQGAGSALPTFKWDRK